MSSLKKLAGQTAIYGLSSVFGRLLNYLLVPIYTRCFLPEEYGIVTELYAYVAFLVVILTYGIETAFFNFSKKEKNTDTVYSTSFISLIITSAVFVVLIYINSLEISRWMGYGIESKYVKWFAFIVALDAISSISFAKLREEEKAIRFTLIRLIGIIINIGLNLYFILYKDLGIEYIFISNLISSIATIILLTPEMLRTKLTFDLFLWRKMIFYGFPLLIAGMAGMINETIDRILLKHLQVNLTPKEISFELGLYGAFYKLSIIMTLFIQTFRFAAEPFFFAQNKNNMGKKIYADVMKFFVIFMSVIFLIVTTFYDFFINFLGKNYNDERGFMVVSILLLANLFLGVFYNLSVWYKLTEKTIFGAYLSIFGAIITIALNVYLIPIMGFVGSAWATLACYFCMALASYFIGKKHFYIPYEVKRILLYLFVVLLIYFVVYFGNLNVYVSTILLIGFFIFVYFLETVKTKSQNECKNHQ